MNQKKHTILTIEDEAPIRKLFCIALESNGYKVIESEDGKSGIRMAACVKPSLILVDLGLPDMDGKDVLKKITEDSQVPVIVCSVRSDDDEMLSAFELGAADYVTKPFNPDILLARIKANMRKSIIDTAGECEFTNGDIRIDLLRHEVYIGDVLTTFTPKEYDLLKYFMVNQGKMLTHKQILKDVWGSAHCEDTQYLRVYVGQLREKIERDSAATPYIMTELGVGYRMDSLPRSDAEQSLKAA